jgi:heat shock protein HslJ
MFQQIIYSIVRMMVLMGMLWALSCSVSQDKLHQQETSAREYTNAAYVIDGRRITLTNGVSTMEAAPGSAATIVTRYFGHEVRKDLDGDGREDIVFLLTQETGGSGTLFYVVAALQTPTGYVGSQGLLLGDRIAPQTTASGAGKMVVVQYADRAPGEAFSLPPSVGKRLWLLLDPTTRQFGTVAQEVAGEAGPSRMTLGMKTWHWIKAIDHDGREVLPKQRATFTLTFTEAGTFAATTDCNSMSGNYTAHESHLAFGPLAATKKYCEDSQEGAFATLLQQTQRYHFTSQGDLVLELTSDSASMTFR